MVETAATFAGATVEIEGNESAGKASKSHEDQKVETQPGVHKGMAWYAAWKVQDFAKTVLGGKKPVEQWTDAHWSRALNFRLLGNF